MYKSKIKATPKELEELMELSDAVTNTPVIAFSSAHAMTGGASADARRILIRRMDEIAKGYGLECQAGEWGIDKDGYFLSMHPIKEHAVESSDA